MASNGQRKFEELITRVYNGEKLSREEQDFFVQYGMSRGTALRSQTVEHV